VDVILSTNYIRLCKESKNKIIFVSHAALTGAPGNGRCWQRVARSMWVSPIHTCLMFINW